MVGLERLRGGRPAPAAQVHLQRAQARGGEGVEERGESATGGRGRRGRGREVLRAVLPGHVDCGRRDARAAAHLSPGDPFWLGKIESIDAQTQNVILEC